MPLSSSSQNIKYHIRYANKKDITQIDECNRMNLPEHYNYQFYENHLIKWPDLSLVAETDQREMVGYALGRIESLPSQLLAHIASPPSYLPSAYAGHVASIAVNPKFRGQGVAQQLMREMHRSIAVNYHVDTVNLYCRASNTAALNLYSQVFLYQCERVAHEYYEDKEDAYFMTLSGLLAQHLPGVVVTSSQHGRKIMNAD
eukprot:gene45884-56156_t